MLGAGLNRRSDFGELATDPASGLSRIGQDYMWAFVHFFIH